MSMIDPLYSLSGFAVGFLVARLTHLSSKWEGAISAAAAILGGLLVLALERMARRPDR